MPPGRMDCCVAVHGLKYTRIPCICKQRKKPPHSGQECRGNALASEETSVRAPALPQEVLGLDQRAAGVGCGFGEGGQLGKALAIEDDKIACSHAG